MLERLSRLAAGRRSKWAIMAGWVALAVALAPLQPRLQDRAADESDTFRARSADSTRAEELLDRRFPESGDATAVVVLTADQGSIYAHSAVVTGYLNEICAAPTIPDLKGVGGPDGAVCGDLGHDLGPSSPPSAVSEDDPQSSVLISVVTTEDDTPSVVRDVAALRAILPGPDGDPVRSHVTGQAGFDADREAALQGIDETLLAITMVLVLALLLVTYRSPAVALVPLAVVICAYLVAAGLVYGLVEAGATTVSGQATAILIVLMFGAGTDYCLLLVARYREELRRTEDVHAAMATAAERTGPAILSAGGTVVAAMLVLALASFNATREMGPILALGTAVMMLAGLTLLPAVLTVLGRKAFWPAIPEAGSAPPRRSVWRRIGEVVRRRPVLTAAAVTAVLVAGALGNLEGRGHLDFTEQFRDPPESVLGQELIRERYPPGRGAPLDVVTTGDGIAAMQALREVDGVETASADSQSEDGSVVSLEVVLAVDPFSERARELVPTLRRTARDAAGDGLTLIGGITAEAYDTERATSSDARLIAPLALLLVFAILVALLRSLVAPLYVVVTVVLSFAFALGASSLVFTHLLGHPDSDPNHATFAFIFLVALGVDYNIFLLSRIREEHQHGRPIREAVIAGLERTGGVITSAGLILAGTFAALMALELEPLFQIGFTVSLGLLVDTFLVRSLLVPAIAYMLGDWSWWPRSGRPTPRARRSAGRTRASARFRGLRTRGR